MNYIQSFYVKPSEHEVVETSVSLALDKRPALTGTVSYPDGKPVEAALITFYRADLPSRPVGALYTDEFGRFSFGPLEPGQLYHVKVFHSDGEVRTLEQNLS